MKELEPGIYEGISNEEYHALPYINKSGLDAFARSPLHYYAAYRDPKREPRVETPAMALGSAIHRAILEPSVFQQQYRVRPTKENVPAAIESADEMRAILKELNIKAGTTKAAMKEAIKAVNNSYTFLDDLVEAASKFKLISQAELDMIRRIHAGFHGSEAANEVFSSGIAEATMIWIDPNTFVKCKARADWISRPDHFLADLKSADDASPEAFAKACANYGYHRQAAWYLDGYFHATGMEAKSFLFAVFEKKAPYASAFYEASAEMLEMGRLENEALLRKFSKCERANEWPGYSNLIQEISLPKWAKLNDAVNEEY